MSKGSLVHILQIMGVMSVLGIILILIFLCSLYQKNGKREISVFNDGENKLFVEYFGLSKYKCTGSCYCEESNVRRVSSTMNKGGIYLLAAVSSIVAYNLAKDHFSEECSNFFSEEEDCSVISEVDSCDVVYDDDKEDLEHSTIELEENQSKELQDEEEMEKDVEDEKCVLCIGDSLTAGYSDYGFNFHPYSKKLQKLIDEDDNIESNYRVASYGVSGECTEQMLPRCKRVFDRVSQDMDISHVIILGGSNDCGMGEDPDDVVGNLECMYTHCLKKEDALVFSVQVPTNEFDQMDKDYNEMKNEYNEKLRLYCENTERVFLVDIGDFIEMSEEERQMYWEEDKLHYTKDGYDMIARKIFKVLRKHL